jgi:capsid portal protein
MYRIPAQSMRLAQNNVAPRSKTLKAVTETAVFLPARTALDPEVSPPESSSLPASSLLELFEF